MVNRNQAHKHGNVLSGTHDIIHVMTSRRPIKVKTFIVFVDRDMYSSVQTGYLEQHIKEIVLNIVSHELNQPFSIFWK